MMQLDDGRFNMRIQSKKNKIGCKLNNEADSIWEKAKMSCNFGTCDAQSGDWWNTLGHSSLDCSVPNEIKWLHYDNYMIFVIEQHLHIKHDNYVMMNFVLIWSKRVN
eukprot:152803_1